MWHSDKGRNVPLLRYRKQVHDIAKEAVKPSMSMALDKCACRL